LCYTGEADGRYTGPIAGWKNAGHFFTSLARWASGKSQGLGRDVVATQELRGGACRIVLHLDPARESAPFSRLPEVTTLAARPGETAVPKKARMNWASADTLEAEIPITGGETVLTTISAPGMGQTTLAPMCLPYSPEFQPQKAGRGVAELERLAKSTGGCERVNLADVWRDIPKRPQQIPLGPYLLLAAVLLFLLEVVQRRTGLLSFRWKPAGPAWRSAAEKVQNRTASIFRRKAKPKEPAVAETKASETPAVAPPVSKPTAGGESMFDALSQAQRRARQRTERD
jgi:hypothetical protein